jgi:hypothetical protein
MTLRWLWPSGGFTTIAVVKLRAGVLDGLLCQQLSR